MKNKASKYEKRELAKAEKPVEWKGKIVGKMKGDSNKARMPKYKQWNEKLGKWVKLSKLEEIEVREFLKGKK